MVITNYQLSLVDDNNIVINCIVLGANDCVDATGTFNLQIAAANAAKFISTAGTWLNSTNDGTTYTYNGWIGQQYVPEKDCFLPIKPHNSWVVNESKTAWIAPVPIPNCEHRDKFYVWNETTLSWELTSLPEDYINNADPSCYTN